MLYVRISKVFGVAWFWPQVLFHALRLWHAQGWCHVYSTLALYLL